MELPETGIHALIAWCCGPEHVVRYRDDRTPPPVRVTSAKGEKTVTRFEERTRTDQAKVESDIDSYLADAGVPGQPFGYRWFVELPAGISTEEELFAVFDSRLAEEVSGPSTPDRELPILRRTARDIYQEPDPESERT